MAPDTTALILAKAGRFRTGVHTMLSADPTIEKIVSIEAFEDFVPTINELKPTFVLIEFDLACTELSKLVQCVDAISPDTRCLVLTDCPLRQYLAKKSGAHEVLRNGFSIDQLNDKLEKLTQQASQQNPIRSQDDFRNPQPNQNLQRGAGASTRATWLGLPGRFWRFHSR